MISKFQTLFFKHDKLPKGCVNEMFFVPLKIIPDLSKNVAFEFYRQNWHFKYSNLRGKFFLKFESIFGSAENIFEFSVKIIFWRFEFLCQKPSSEFAIFRKDFEKNVKISREAKSFVKFC